MDMAVTSGKANQLAAKQTHGSPTSRRRKIGLLNATVTGERERVSFSGPF